MQNHYSYSYGREVYEAFREALPAPCLIVETLYNLDDFYIIDMFCREQKRWNKFKAAVKALAKRKITWEEFNNMSTEEFRWLRKWLDAQVRDSIVKKP